VVDVADLYFNTPARRKFLKSEGTEFAHCDDVFRRVALARPDVALQLTHNGRVSLRLPSGRREARVRALLGDDFLAPPAASRPNPACSASPASPRCRPTRAAAATPSSST
jgi:DNA mismatch repair protein MutL